MILFIRQEGGWTMDVTTLMVNQVIEDLSTGVFYRLLWISPDRKEAFWIPVSDDRRIPERAIPDTILQGLGNGSFVFSPDKWMPSVSDGCEKHSQRRDRAWNLISGIVGQEPDIYLPKKRAALLREVSSANSIQIPNIYEYLGRYWKGGKVPNALIPRYENCGKASVRGKTQARRGRKKTEGAEGKTLTDRDFQIFTDSILEWYMGTEQLTLEKTFTNMIAKYYTGKDSEGNPVRFSPDDVPSRNQFLYWHRKHRDLLAEEKARKGSRTYTLENRGGTGRTETFLSGPCASSQIDATIADIFLVSRHDRNSIVGRPIMYFLMDSYSRMVMGMYISLDPPSWRSAAQCILNATEDKVAFCAEYGVNIRPEEWPCMHAPNAIVADRGEMETATADLLVKELGIRLEVMPPYRGDLKGMIEKHFNTIDVQLSDLPGKMKKDYGKRCTEDYRLGARLDIWEFTQIIIRLVLLYNNYHYLESYQKSMHMRQMRILPIARDIWNYGLKYHSGGQRVMNRESVRYALLPTSTASITSNGIMFNGLYYSCRKACEEHWFDSARTSGRQEVTVSYDPRSTDSIYIRPSKNEPPVECTLLEGNKLDTSLSSAELAKMHESDTAERNRHQAEEDFQTAKTSLEIEKIVSVAEQKASASPTDKSNAKRLKEIAENRKKEISAQYAQNEKPHEGASSQDESQEELSPIQKEIQRQLNKALEGGEQS